MAATFFCVNIAVSCFLFQPSLTNKDISFIIAYMAVRIADREQRNEINFLH